MLDPRVHVPADAHLRGYVKQVSLTDYDVHNYVMFPKFAPEKYAEWKVDYMRTMKPFRSLWKSGLMHLFNVPCFGNYPAVRKR